MIKKTKTCADRRNELIHAEYVVHGVSNSLYSKVTSPRSLNPPKYQRAMKRDLERAAEELSHLIQATESASIELMNPDERADWDALLAEVRQVSKET